MTILEELYNGNINPSDKFVKKGGEYGRLLNEYAVQLDRLTAMLDEGEKKLLESILETNGSMEIISHKESFIEGFCLGSRIMLEILNRDLTDRTVL